MSTRILVVDADVPFATMIKQALEDLGEYRVTVSGASPQAIGLAAQESFDLAIVDMGLPDVSGEDTIRGLRATRPSLPVIAIPFGADSGDPLFGPLDLQGFLSKPFFLPDLGDIVEAALSQPVGGVLPPPRARPPAKPAAAPAPPAGAPPRPQAPNLPEPPEWLKNGATAARLLAGVARAAAVEAALLVGGSQLVAYAGPFPKQDTDELAQFVLGNWSPEKRGSQNSLMRFVKLSGSGTDYLLFAMVMAIDTVLALAFKPDVPVGVARKQAREAAAMLLKAPQAQAPASPPPATVVPERPRPAPQTRPLPPEMLFDFAPAAAVAEPPGAVLVETVPDLAPLRPPSIVVDAGLLLPTEDRMPDMERTPHALYNLSYTMAWAPKYPKTRLTGDITGRLDEWIRHLALSYDWRVERVEVRPECVIAILNGSPATAPEQLVNVLKQATSTRVMAEFPSIAADHPGGDFWAPGYLLLGAGQPLTPQQIGDFLVYTRRGQGIER